VGRKKIKSWVFKVFTPCKREDEGKENQGKGQEKKNKEPGDET